MPQLAVNVSTTTPVMQQGGRLQSGTARAPEHHNAHPGRVLPLGSRAGWSFRSPRMWSSTPQRVLFPIDNVRLRSARGDRRVATPPEFVYRHNSLVGHALLWGRMHDELQQDFRSSYPGALGAEIAGVDLSRPLSDEVIGE